MSVKQVTLSRSDGFWCLKAQIGENSLQTAATGIRVTNTPSRCHTFVTVKSDALLTFRLILHERSKRGV